MTLHHQVNSRDVVQELKSIWMQLLNVDDVPDAANFVELGGDSMTAAACLNQIRRVLGVDVPITTLLMEDADFCVLVEEVQRRVRPRGSS